MGFDPTSVVQIISTTSTRYMYRRQGKRADERATGGGLGNGQRVDQVDIAPTIGFSRPTMQDNVVDSVAGTCAMRLRRQGGGVCRC